MHAGVALTRELRDAGMTVELANDQIMVAPRDRITDQMRGRVRYHRRQIIEQLRLEQRIRAMAARWGYSPEELVEALERAQSDPQGWLIWIERDERDFGNCVTPHDFAEAYRRAQGLT
jgi:hypothetical protein